MDAKYGIIFLSFVGVALGTDCSEAIRDTNLDQCLEKIVEAGLDNDKFWFGSQYGTDCPLGPISTECFNPKPETNRRSLLNRLFPSGYDTTKLDRYLKVVFTTPPGNYTGCGNTYTVNSTWTQEVDPLSDDVVTPWYVRLVPTVEWEANSTDMFTLVVYDVGYMYTHGVYINIQGGNLMDSPGQVIKAYHGPQMTTMLTNPYIFLLFGQSGPITLTQDWNQKLTNRQPANYDFNEFITQTGLTGPVAMNWVAATGDVYAAERMKNMGVPNMCPNFVAQHLNIRPRPFLPTSPEFSVGVHVNFTVMPLDFTACCSRHTYGQESFELNPLGNPIYDTYKTSQKPFITLMKKGRLQDATNFTGEIHTLIVVDPDVPVAEVGTQERPLLHWLVYNIPHGNVDSGMEYKNYRGPAPPDRKTHYYYFLLYKQDYGLGFNDFSLYSSNACPQSLNFRCLYDVNSLVANHNLTFVGATWMTATTDIYVAKTKIEAGDDVNSWCTGMPGYGGDPSCPTQASSQTYVSLLVILLAFLFLIV